MTGRGFGTHNVQVLNWGSLAAIRAALLARRFHVLHPSCRAGRGMLVLENAAGQADPVGATRFAAEGLPADRGVPLVMLAGCSTATAPNPENASPDPEDGAPDARRTVAAVMSSVYLGLAYRALHLLPGTLTGLV